MRHGLLAAALFASLASTPALAQTLSPFADAAAISRTRGATQNATLRITYTATVTDASHSTPHQFNLVLDVAEDWVLVRNDQQVLLHDYRLNRLFALDEGARSFISYNAAAPIAFRVMERQNRTYLAQILTRTGVPLPADDCDAESELGVAFQGSPARASFRASGGVTDFLCNSRVLGSFETGTGVSPPASFWPALASALTVHPALFERIRTTGRPPISVLTTFRQAPAHEARLEFHLTSAIAVNEPYPLTANMNNVNAAALDAALSTGVGVAGSDAVAGRAMGGPPTLASWGQYLAQVGARDGQPAEAMLVGMTYNLFPQIIEQCRRRQQNPACPAIANLGSTINADAAVHAMYAIASAEQQNRLSDVIAEMRAAQASPLAHHPVLGESYALALLRFDDALVSQARAANLPTDPKPLMAAALRAYPYYAAYWTDVGGWLSQQYDWMNAALFYDVADALPFPEAQQDRALQGAKQLFARIRQDFPSYWLAPQ